MYLTAIEAERAIYTQSNDLLESTAPRSNMLEGSLLTETPLRLCSLDRNPITRCTSTYHRRKMFSETLDLLRFMFATDSSFNYEIREQHECLP